MAMRMPMMRTTTISSMRVKPSSRLIFLDVLFISFTSFRGPDQPGMQRGGGPLWLPPPPRSDRLPGSTVRGADDASVGRGAVSLRHGRLGVRGAGVGVILDGEALQGQGPRRCVEHVGARRVDADAVGARRCRCGRNERQRRLDGE